MKVTSVGGLKIEQVDYFATNFLCK